MTQEKIVACLCEVHGLAMCDQEFASGIREAVDANAIVLDNVDAAIGRLELQVAVIVSGSD